MQGSDSKLCGEYFNGVRVVPTTYFANACAIIY
jgi:hypothetical protein